MGHIGSLSSPTVAEGLNTICKVGVVGMGVVRVYCGGQGDARRVTRKVPSQAGLHCQAPV